MAVPVPTTLTTIDVAQAVAAEMNAPVQPGGIGTLNFSQGFGCSQMWLPTFDSTMLATLQIAVVAIREDRTRWTRGGTERRHVCHLAFQKKMDPTAATYQADIETQARFVFEVEDYWLAAHRQIAAASWPAGWSTKPIVFSMESRVIAINNPKADAEQGMFAALLELVFMERTQA